MSYKIDIDNIILEIRRQPRKSGGPRIVLICKCKSSHCTRKVSIRKADIKKHTGKCHSCTQKKKPFESIYYGFINRKERKHLTNTLTYDEFLKFTEIKNCHYCLSLIPWQDYGTVNNQFTSRGYYLDRKDSVLGYTNENCVTCCTKCNKAKSNSYTYKEWHGMTEYLRKRKI